MANFELKVQPFTNAPVVWNYEELKENLTVALADYKDRVYTEDTIGDAKEDRAKLNKLKTAIDNERKNRKKEYMQPFEKFESQAKEIVAIIDEVSTGIGTQLDAFEEQRVAKKKELIQSLFDEIISNYDGVEFVTCGMISDIKWLNKSVSEKAIAAEITAKLDQIKRDLEVISKMPNYSFEAKEAYKVSLDLNQALAEGEKQLKVQEAKRQEALAKAQAEIDSRKHIEKLNSLSTAEPEAKNEPLYDLTFSCRITKAQAVELKQFCDAHGIKLIKV